MCVSAYVYCVCLSVLNKHLFLEMRGGEKLRVSGYELYVDCLPLGNGEVLWGIGHFAH